MAEHREGDYSAYADSYDHSYVLDDLTPEFIAKQCRDLDATKFLYGSNTKANMKKSKKSLSDHLAARAALKIDMPNDD